MTSSSKEETLESSVCSQCQKPATFMCSSCGQDGPKYCSIECQKTHWTDSHYKHCKASKRKRSSRKHTKSGTTAENIPLNDLSVNEIAESEQEKAKREQEEDEAEELHFYTNQIYRIIKPVVACIILSIFWVKVSFNDQSDYSPVRTGYVTLSSSATTTNNNNGSGSSNGPNIASSFTNAAIIIGQIIVVTIIIVFLFKKGWIKVLIGFFMLVVLSLLGFMTYLLLLNLVQVFAIPLDYITLVFALWNFAAVGLVSIFWKGPLWLQQVYLTIMSSLMAFSLTGLEQWTTWILLGLLAIWDLIAVLCPFGPLRLLLESSKKQQREVPALLYTVNAVWFMMASTDQLRLSRQLESSSSNQRYSAGSSYSPSTFIRKSHDGFMRLPDHGVSTQNDIPLPANVDRTSHSVVDPPIKPETDSQKEQQDDDDDQETSGLKLGLGDFVFYSVLIARAAMYDWITTACCTIAVLTGLTATIFLLAIYKKALPALPISIAFGILFYFVAKTVLVPYVAALCVFGMVGL